MTIFAVQLNETEYYLTDDYTDAMHASGNDYSPYVSTVADKIRDYYTEDDTLEVFHLDTQDVLKLMQSAKNIQREEPT